MFHFEKVLKITSTPTDTRTAQMIYTDLLEHPKLTDALILEGAYIKYALDKKERIREEIDIISAQDSLRIEDELRLSTCMQELADMRVFEKELEDFKLASMPNEEDTPLDLAVRDEIYSNEELSMALYNLLSLRITAKENYPASKVHFFERYPHIENNFDTYIKAFKTLYNM